VAAGNADAGLGLRATAEKLGLGFVSLGDQDVVVRLNPDREEKSGVRELTATLTDLGDVCAEFPGYSPR
jgi:putative molybdopterin biosynthesis protein